MAFKTSDRRFGLGNGLRYIVESRIPRVEPCTAVSIEYPVSPTLGVAKFRLECPTVNSPIEEPRRSVLSRWCHQLDARAHNDLLPPFGELLGLHCRATYQVYRCTGCKVEQARTVHGFVPAKYASAKRSHSVRLGNGEVRGPSEDA